jgi:competence protein ComEC
MVEHEFCGAVVTIIAVAWFRSTCIAMWVHLQQTGGKALSSHERCRMSGVTAALLGLVSGVAVQLQQAALWPLECYLGLLSVAIVVAVLAGRCLAGALRAALWALAFAALSTGLTGWRAVAYLQNALPPVLENQNLELVGHVSGLPRVSGRGVQFEFTVDSARLQGQAVQVPSKVQLGWHAPFDRAVLDGDDSGENRGALPRVQAGQRWQLTARLKRPHGLSNPHGFDLEGWMWEQGWLASGTVRTGRKYPAPVLLPERAWTPVATARQQLRDAIFRQVPDARAAGVLAALVVGDQASIDSTDWEVFRTTGTAHAMAISGLHITMFAVLAVWWVGGVWRVLAHRWPALLYHVSTPNAAAVGGLLLATAYAVLAGWGVPSQRTVLMLAVLTLLRLSGRRWPWPAVWLFAMASVLLLDPWAFLQAGFWLSFVAVGVLFASSGTDVLAPKGLRQHLVAMVRTQAVVTVALAPLTLLLFGQFSLVGLVANLLVIPWVTFWVTPLAMGGVVMAPLWNVGAWAVQGMIWGLEWMAALPGAALERPALPLGLAALTVVGAVILVLRLPVAWRAWGLLLAWPALTYLPPRPSLGHFELVMPDVGQGGAVLVRTAQHTLLYDTGPQQSSGNSAARRVLSPLLRGQGDRPHRIVVSHNDSDHAGGLSTVAAQYPRADLWASFDTLPVAGRAATRCEAGQSWEWDGVRFTVLHPRAEDYDLGWDDNALSCVLQVTAEGEKGMRVAVLSGDMSVKEEARLVQDFPDLRVDLLVAPHHGSKTSSSAQWLDAVQPKQIVIQSGHHNRYGHPSPQVVARYDERDIPWVNSPTCGAARWRSEAPAELDCHRVLHRRYWHDPVADLTSVKQRAKTPEALAR